MCLEDVYKVFFQILNCKADRQTDRQKNTEPLAHTMCGVIILEGLDLKVWVKIF